MRSHWRSHGGQTSGLLSVTWDLKLVIKSNVNKQTNIGQGTIFFLLELNQTKPVVQQNQIYWPDAMREVLQRSCEVLLSKRGRRVRQITLQDSVSGWRIRGRSKGSGDQCCTGCSFQGRIMRSGDQLGVEYHHEQGWLSIWESLVKDGCSKTGTGASLVRKQRSFKVGVFMAFHCSLTLGERLFSVNCAFDFIWICPPNLVNSRAYFHSSSPRQVLTLSVNWI